MTKIYKKGFIKIMRLICVSLPDISVKIGNTKNIITKIKFLNGPFNKFTFDQNSPEIRVS